WLYGPFDRMNAVLGGWLLRGDHVRKIPVNLDDYETLVLPFRNIVFVEDQTYFQEWLEKLSNDGAPLGTPPEDVPVEKEVAVTSDEPFQVSDDTATATKVLSGKTTSRAAERKQYDPKSEVGFLDRLRRTAQSDRLFYDENDLINFHTALKTGSLVLLSGMSGTGKTRLVQVYAKALGLAPGEQFRIIPIRPTWT